MLLQKALQHQLELLELSLVRLARLASYTHSGSSTMFYSLLSDIGSWGARRRDVIISCSKIFSPLRKCANFRTWNTALIISESGWVITFLSTRCGPARSSPRFFSWSQGHRMSAQCVNPRLRTFKRHGPSEESVGLSYLCCFVLLRIRLAVSQLRRSITLLLYNT
jgi:hypothetical protein